MSEIVSAVDGRCEVYLDGGVRTGTDVLKALALGAKAVFIGRPALYALAYNVYTSHKPNSNIISVEIYIAPLRVSTHDHSRYNLCRTHEDHFRTSISDDLI